MILNQWLRDLLGTNSELEPKEFNPPVFVTGCMRSGTTMLVNKLSQHPQLFKVGGELNTIWSKIGGARVYPINEYKSIEDASFEFSNNMTNYFTRSIEESKSFKRHVMRMVYLNKTGGGRVFYDWDRVKVLAKSPHLINKVGYLKGIYPKSKIVLIIRPIHEQVASLKMHIISHNEVRALPKNEMESWRTPSTDPSEDLLIYPPDFKAIPQMWIRLNSLCIKELRKMNEDDYCIIKYDDLVNNEGKTIEKLYKFMDLSEVHEKEAQKIVEKSIKIYNTTTSGDPRQKWKKHLNDEEKKQIDDCIEEFRSDYDFILDALK